ncbi:MAG: carboxypeptidase regulatory-like domain-containing protein, partial [Lachnospiraceae bacterium]|nr:carboxypeptidase regulatory-like domain-containing protein [Lachnospiraceae bacterium]
DLEVTVKEEGSTTVIPGAEVVITDEAGKEVERTTTDEDGKVTVKDLPIGDYTVTVETVPEGYEEPTGTETVTVPEEDTGKAVIELVKETEPEPEVGSLKVIVTEKDNAENKIAGVKVTVTGPNNYSETLTTDANGEASASNLPVGNYTVTVDGTTVPAEYKVSGASTATEAVKAKETTTYEFVVEPKVGDLEVTVKEEGSTTVIPGAEVVITDEAGKEVERTTTDEDGKVTVKDLPIGDYTVTVETVPEGYEEPTGTETVTVPEGDTGKAVIELVKETEPEPETKTGDLEVTVKEEESGEVIPGADVVITDKDGNKVGEGTTDENGKVIVEDLPVGDYVVTVEKVPEGYEKPEESESVTVPEGDVGKAEVVVPEPETGDLEITVTDERTGDEVPGAKVEVKDEKGNMVAEGTTDKDGKVVVEDLPTGKYTVTITEAPDDYTVTTDKEVTQEVKANDTTKYEYKVDKLGDLEITVTDERTGDKVPGAKVEVKDEKGKTVATGTTDKDGKVVVEDLPTGKYTVTITEAPDDYTVTTDKEVTQEVKANDTTEYEYKVDKLGDLEITVTDERTGDEVPGAKVEVKDEKGNKVAEGTTNKDGKVTVEDLPTGKYTVTITEAPDDYTVTTDKEVTQEVKANETTEYEYKVDKLGDLEIKVTDERTGDKVPGAKVEVKDETGKTVATGTTDKDGKVVVEDLPTGKYTVTITEAPDDYTVTTDKEVTQEVKANETTEYEYKVDKLGSLTITVKDDNGTEIQGAKVVITYPDGTKDKVVTDSEGKVKVDKLPADEYTVTITKIPDGYTVTTDKEFKKEVKANEDTVYEFEINTQDAVGHLSVVVTDERTGAKVPNAKVSITGPNSYKKQATTDTNGGIMVNALKVGTYTVTIKTVPDDYTVTTDKEIVQEVVANKVTEYEYKVDKVGNLTIIVTDERTGAKVPDAKLEVKDEKGKVVAEQTTDKKGKATVEKLPTGNYTVTITEVPDGYTVTTDKEVTQEVKANETTKYEYKVDKLGNLIITVTDERTGVRVPDAKVEVKNGKGKVVAEKTTDKNGEATIEKLPTGKYTVTITEVPDGYTVTTDKKVTQEVKANETTEYEYKVDKFGDLTITVTDEKTGDKVPNAKVEVKDEKGKVIAEKTTNKKGEATVEDLPTGKYTVTITEVPDGYTVTTDKAVTQEVKANDTTDYEFKIDKTPTNNNNSNNSSNNTAPSSTATPAPAPAVSEVAGIAKAPKTGDEATLYVVFAMMMFAGAGYFALVSDKKRNKK